MIAMALACGPDVLIADEPTTALDVTIQAQILDLVQDIQKRTDSAIILITHDLGVVADMADRILVMYGGRAVEYGSADDIFYRPLHPYTWGLLESIPRHDVDDKTALCPIKGQPPSLINLPAGCSFNPRCAYAQVDLPVQESASRGDRPGTSRRLPFRRRRGVRRPVRGTGLLCGCGRAPEGGR